MLEPPADTSPTRKLGNRCGRLTVACTTYHGVAVQLRTSPMVDLPYPSQPPTGSTTMHNVSELVRNFVREEEGASAVEYGLLVALIAAIIILTVKSVGTKTNTAFESINSNMP